MLLFFDYLLLLLNAYFERKGREVFFSYQLF